MKIFKKYGLEEIPKNYVESIDISHPTWFRGAKKTWCSDDPCKRNPEEYDPKCHSNKKIEKKTYQKNNIEKSNRNWDPCGRENTETSFSSGECDYVGTGSASVISAITNNNKGIQSIAYNAKIMPFRIANKE